MENRDYGPSYRGRENDRDYDDDNFGQRERGDRWERQRERGRFFDSGDINRGSYESDRPYRGGGAEREYRDEWQRGRSYEGRGRTEQDRPERGFGGGPSYGRERYSGGTSDYEGRRSRGSMERTDLYDREPDRRFSRQDYPERDYRNEAGDFGAHGSWDYASSSGPYRSSPGRDYAEREPFAFGGPATGYGPSTGYGYGTAGRYIDGPESRSMRSRDERMREGVFTGRGPKGYRRSDERVREDVNERLTRHPDLDASDIDVRVDNCEVVLTGVVEDRRAKRLAEDIVEDVWGVNDVRNELKVRRGFLASLTGERADERDVTRPAVRDVNAEPNRTPGRSTSGPGGATTQPSAVNPTSRP